MRIGDAAMSRPIAVIAAVALAGWAWPPQVALAQVQAAAPDPGGVWFTEGRRSTVRFDRCGGGWCGRIERILIRDPKSPQQDVKNPDPGLRARPMVGLQLFSLPSAQGGSWRGTVYDPRSGQTYTASVRRVGSDTLEMKGCLMIFCKTQIWTTS